MQFATDPTQPCSLCGSWRTRKKTDDTINWSHSGRSLHEKTLLMIGHRGRRVTAVVQRVQAATVATPKPGISMNVERGELLEEATLREAMWLKRIGSKCPFPPPSRLLLCSPLTERGHIPGRTKSLSLHSQVSQGSSQNSCPERTDQSLSELWLVLPFLYPDRATQRSIVRSYFYDVLKSFPTPIFLSHHCKINCPPAWQKDQVAKLSSWHLIL